MSEFEIYIRRRLCDHQSTFKSKWPELQEYPRIRYRYFSEDEKEKKNEYSKNCYKNVRK